MLVCGHKILIIVLREKRHVLSRAEFLLNTIKYINRAKYRFKILCINLYIFLYKETIFYYTFLCQMQKQQCFSELHA